MSHRLSSNTIVAGGYPFNSTNRNRHSYFPWSFWKKKYIHLRTNSIITQACSQLQKLWLPHSSPQPIHFSLHKVCDQSWYINLLPSYSCCSWINSPSSSPHVQCLFFYCHPHKTWLSYRWHRPQCTPDVCSIMRDKFLTCKSFHATTKYKFLWILPFCDNTYWTSSICTCMWFKNFSHNVFELF